jgi:hypothetical protein
MTPEECLLLEYYTEELHRQIVPVWVNPQDHCHDSLQNSITEIRYAA